MHPTPGRAARTPSRRAVVGLALTLLAGCSGSTPSPDAGPAGGPVAGAADTHCALTDGGVLAVAISAAACHPDAGPPEDGGMDMGEDYGAPLFNAEGDDDDCKYHLAFTSTPVRQNADVTFTATVTRKAGGAPDTGADVLAEVFLSDTHPAPNSNTTTSEAAGGKYTIGPVRFDQPGRWTVRFHLHDECEDGEDSPHGHVAFFVDVP